jgi:hypothetical protein
MSTMKTLLNLYYERWGTGLCEFSQEFLPLSRENDDKRQFAELDIAQKCAHRSISLDTHRPRDKMRSNHLKEREKRAR